MADLLFLLCSELLRCVCRFTKCVLLYFCFPYLFFPNLLLMIIACCLMLVFFFLPFWYHCCPLFFCLLQYAPFLALPGGVGHAIKEGFSSGSGFDGTVFRMSLRTRPGEISGFECTAAAVEREVHAEEWMKSNVLCSDINRENNVPNLISLFLLLSPPYHLIFTSLVELRQFTLVYFLVKTKLKRKDV